MAKTKIGVGECDRCGEGIVWKRADSGSLSYTCQHCDFQGYARAYTDAARMVESGFGPVEPQATVKAPIAKPLPPEVPPAPPKPAPKKTNIWGMAE